MDFIFIKVAIMARNGKRVMAYSESDIHKYAMAGYQLIGYETEWI
jgi:hypothetical protein